MEHECICHTSRRSLSFETSANAGIPCWCGLLVPPSDNSTQYRGNDHIQPPRIPVRFSCRAWTASFDELPSNLQSALEKLNTRQSPNFRRGKNIRMLANYVVGQFLGRGRHSKVRYGYAWTSNVLTPVALKFVFREAAIRARSPVFERSKVRMLSVWDKICAEVVMLSRLDHKNIVKLHEVLVNELHDLWVIVLELVPHRSATYCIEEGVYRVPPSHDLGAKNRVSAVYTETGAKLLVRDLFSALRYLHEEWGIVHKDIKPENFLVTSLDYQWIRPVNSTSATAHNGEGTITVPDKEDNGGNPAVLREKSIKANQTAHRLPAVFDHDDKEVFDKEMLNHEDREGREEREEREERDEDINDEFSTDSDGTNDFVWRENDSGDGNDSAEILNQAIYTAHCLCCAFNHCNRGFDSCSSYSSDDETIDRDNFFADDKRIAEQSSETSSVKATTTQKSLCFKINKLTEESGATKNVDIGCKCCRTSLTRPYLRNSVEGNREAIGKLIDFNTAVQAAKPFLLTFDSNGTRLFTAPECLEWTAENSEKSVRGQGRDVWAAGCLTFALVTGELPFQAENPMEIIIKICRTEPNWSVLEKNNLSSECCDFLRRALNRDPRDRLTVAEALLHPWLALSSTKS